MAAPPNGYDQAMPHHQALNKPVVSTLKIVTPGLGKADEDMVEMLESFITRVKAGELNFLGVVAGYRDAGTISSGWVKRSDASRFQILGALEDLKMDFWAKNIESKE